MANSSHRPIRPATPLRSARAQKITPVPRESTVDLIAGRLRQAIFEGTLPAGAPLGEAELAEQLGVSRGPLREAAQRLVQERLLTTTRRRGLAVISMDAATVADVYLGRTAVECAACRVVLRDNLVDRTVRTLTRVHQRMVRANKRRDAHAVGDTDIEFHQALVDAAGSPRLSASIATLLIETRLCTYSLDRQFRVRADMPDSHAEIIDAIAARDEPALLAVVERHMAEAARRLTAPTEVDTISSPAPAAPRPLDPLELPLDD
ncbi:GntR family transcriptional regulator [Actinocatenispora comari]|uniref:GntR family transcriptional regulator n=1 Tax=Actinocatenispora comari TaxID=2807577 RepID=A0A8J4ADX6_9ACTN|nr:GntR family transcriptional regulator [Actinocatenispora comari]